MWWSKVPCLWVFTPTSGKKELETVTLYVLVLLKPHDPSDTKSECSWHALVALHVIQKASCTRYSEIVSSRKVRRRSYIHGRIRLLEGQYYNNWKTASNCLLNLFCFPFVFVTFLDSSLNRNLEWLTFFNFFFVTKCAITLLATRIVSCFFQKGSLQSSC